MLIQPSHRPQGDIQTLVSEKLRKIFFEPGRPVIVAASGGGDSTALLHMVRCFLDAEHKDVGLIAATIDHRLRPESAAEAQMVADVCDRIGVEHRTLRWESAKPQTALQANARLARYRLLTELARWQGAAIVLTGHTADDQAETVAMRQARQAEGHGLAGIDVASLSERAIWFVRPLINVYRAELRQWLASQQLGWIDDPSNDDRRFERVRVRSALSATRRAELVAKANEAATARRGRAESGAHCLNDANLWRIEDATLTFEASQADNHRADALAAAMAAALAWTGCLERLPDADRARTALQFCRKAANGSALTIAGCLLRKRDGLVLLTREARNGRQNSQRCFDMLLPSADWPLAQSLARIGGERPFPSMPFTT